jgi:hypothetical protein
MAQVTYEVALSSSGRYSVSVKGEDPKSIEEALGWAKEIQAQLARARQVAEGEKPEAKAQGEVPTCQVHGVPMVKQNGKFGPFWSCHERNEDGSFCSYKPNDR